MIIISTNFSSGGGGNGVVAVGYNTDRSICIAFRRSAGSAWIASTTNPFAGGQGNGVAYNGSNWVAVGKNGNSSVTAAISSNGSNWVNATRDPFTGGFGSSVVWNDYSRIWVAVGIDPLKRSIFTSTDGSNWVPSPESPFDPGPSTPFAEGRGISIALNNSHYVAVGLGTLGAGIVGITVTSQDAYTWKLASNTSVSSPLSIIWNGSSWISGGTNTTISVSPYVNASNFNGTITTSPFSGSGSVYGLAWDGTNALAVGNGGGYSIAYSPTGSSWTNINNIQDSILRGIAYNGIEWIAVGSVNGSIFTNTNISSSPWISATNPLTYGLGVATQYTEYIFSEGTAPDSPTNLIAMPGDTSVGVSWTPPPQFITGYIISYTLFNITTNTHLYSVTGEVLGITNNIELTGLINGDSYRFVISSLTAYNPYGISTPPATFNGNFQTVIIPLAGYFIILGGNENATNPLVYTRNGISWFSLSTQFNAGGTTLRLVYIKRIFFKDPYYIICGDANNGFTYVLYTSNLATPFTNTTPWGVLPGPVTAPYINYKNGYFFVSGIVAQENSSVYFTQDLSQAWTSGFISIGSIYYISFNDVYAIAGGSATTVYTTISSLIAGNANWQNNNLKNLITQFNTGAFWDPSLLRFITWGSGVYKFAYSTSSAPPTAWAPATYTGTDVLINTVAPAFFNGQQGYISGGLAPPPDFESPLVLTAPKSHHYFSTDGTSWTQVAISFTHSVNHLIYNGNIFFAVSAYIGIKYSTDLVNWANISGIARIFGPGTNVTHLYTKYAPPPPPPPTAPGAPTIDSIGISEFYQPRIYYTPGSTGGSPITTYTYSIDNVNYINLNSVSNPLIIPAVGTFGITIKARNIVGDSPKSNTLSYSYSIMSSMRPINIEVSGNLMRINFVSINPAFFTNVEAIYSFTSEVFNIELSQILQVDSGNRGAFSYNNGILTTDYFYTLPNTYDNSWYMASLKINVRLPSDTSSIISFKGYVPFIPINNFVAVGRDYQNKTTSSLSTTGYYWEYVDNPFPNGTGFGIAWNGSYWCAVGNNNHTGGTISISTNGLIWTPANNNPFTNGTAYGIAWNGSYWCAVGNSPSVTAAKSTNGLDWTNFSDPFPSGSGNGIAWNLSYWVAVGNSSSVTIAKSTDGITWTPANNSPFNNGKANGITWSGNNWVAAGYNSSRSVTLAISPDGLNWTAANNPFGSGGEAYGVASSGSLLVAVGNSANSSITIATSSGGSTWSPAINSPSGLDGPYRGIAWNGTIWIAVGAPRITVVISRNGINWTNISNNNYVTDPFTGGYGYAVASQYPNW